MVRRGVAKATAIGSFEKGKKEKEKRETFMIWGVLWGRRGWEKWGRDVILRYQQQHLAKSYLGGQWKGKSIALGVCS